MRFQERLSKALDYVDDNFMAIAMIIAFTAIVNIGFHVAFLNGQSSYHERIKQECEQAMAQGDASIQTLLECSKYQ